MNRKILVLVSISLLAMLIFPSCNNVDRTDYKSVAKLIDKSLQSQNLDLLKPLITVDGTSFDEFTKSTLNLFNKNKLTLIQVELSEHPMQISEGSKTIWINLYYRDERSNFYCIGALARQRDDGLIALGMSNTITIRNDNFSEYHKEWYETPYCPKIEISFESFWWSTFGFGNNLGFESVILRLKNNSFYNIDYIRFRLIVKNNNVTIFNQTIESYQRIFEGDMVDINIPALRNFYIGNFNRNTLHWSAELIEVRPKPKSWWEDKIEELKVISRKK